MRGALVAIPAGATLFAVVGWRYYHSPYRTGVGIAVDQPVLFSHRHHAQQLLIDCRYCHTGVETSSFAGVPDMHTCLTCHSQVFTDTAMLQPVVERASRGEVLRWNRVNHTPDHVFFNHSAHIAAGLDCKSCHGDVTDMALIRKGQSLDMRWCLDCHREVAATSEVFNAPRTQLTNCSTCHH